MKDASSESHRSILTIASIIYRWKCLRKRPAELIFISDIELHMQEHSVPSFRFDGLLAFPNIFLHTQTRQSLFQTYVCMISLLC
mmetsp:Transcript_1889/g.11420  ORF Transcript_1889/g.11420 Transcript_1889/m.11420 type:complete len:84 (-) Transcript_1889:1908-2159(-)